ncbi:peptide chain release factor 3 [Alteromonas sp. B31-7]|nr:peptide chain release factor 3 [Alteromonas sp. B31-7]QPL49033.1 peptide chain release factor 3 [Alteromonas sp. B31-7]
MSDQKLLEEIKKRRTFAIISHPDAAQPFNA